MMPHGEKLFLKSVYAVDDLLRLPNSRLGLAQFLDVFETIELQKHQRDLTASIPRIAQTCHRLGSIPQTR